MINYIHLTEQDVETLAAGDPVAIQCGKRISRVLTTKTAKQIKLDQARQVYETKKLLIEGALGCEQ